MKRHPIKVIFSVFSLFLIGFSSSWARAGETVLLFGPETYTRTTSAPNSFERSFNLPSGVGAPFTLKVVNGTSDGANRISSASIKLNGTEVVKESDFNQKVSLINKQVPLGTENHLQVELRSKPGSFISVAIFGILMMPSVQKTIGPAGGTIELQGTLNHVALKVPPGALATDTKVAIRQVPNPTPDQFVGESTPLGNTFSFEPRGLTFSKVATIRLTYRTGEVPANAYDLIAHGMSIDSGKILVYTDGPDGLFGVDGGAQCDPEEQPGPHCLNTESYAQHTSAAWDVRGYHEIVFVSVNKLSPRLLAFAGLDPGCSRNLKSKPVQVALEAEGFRLQILRCLRPDVKARPATAQIAKIVLHSPEHSTESGNMRRTFTREINGCAVNERCRFFAHYYIDRDGSIMQVVEDSNLASHILPNTELSVNNSNSIGIVLFNNTEFIPKQPSYDRRQRTALVQLVDLLIRLHPTIQRPIFPRPSPVTNKTSLLSHVEVDPKNKKDPPEMSGKLNEFFYTVRTIDPTTKRPRIDVASRLLPGGSPFASTLFDGVVSAVSTIAKNLSGPVMNKSGGDSLNLANTGSGGNIHYGTMCVSYADLGALRVFGWSPKSNYFAFGYEWWDEAGFHIHSYILNSKQNTFQWQMEQVLRGTPAEIVGQEDQIRNTIGAELKKLDIFSGTQIHRSSESILLESEFFPPDKVSIQIQGRPYHLRLKNQYKEDKGHPMGIHAKFEILLVDDKTQQVQVLQQDKTFFRSAYDYGIYAAYLSPEEDQIAVIIAQWKYSLDGRSAITFLGVTGKIEM